MTRNLRLSILLLFLVLGWGPKVWGQEPVVIQVPATPIINQDWQNPGTILYETGNVHPGLPHMPWGPEPACQDILPKGCWDLQVLAGYYVGGVVGPEVPRYNFAPLAIRLGKVTDCGFCQGPLRGHFEPIIEFSGAPVVNGIGHFYVGASALLRYNFVQPESRLVPYIQVGAGATYNDGYQDPTQTALGQGLEFLLQAQIGVRYFFNPNWSLDIEGGYIHISNANMADRNAGINALGGSIGISYFFGGPRHPERWH